MNLWLWECPPDFCWKIFPYLDSFLAANTFCNRLFLKIILFLSSGNFLFGHVFSLQDVACLIRLWVFSFVPVSFLVGIPGDIFLPSNCLALPSELYHLFYWIKIIGKSKVSVSKGLNEICFSPFLPSFVKGRKATIVLALMIISLTYDRDSRSSNMALLLTAKRSLFIHVFVFRCVNFERFDHCFKGYLYDPCYQFVCLFQWNIPITSPKKHLLWP
jgi:hypothetical protein